MPYTLCNINRIRWTTYGVYAVQHTPYTGYAAQHMPYTLRNIRRIRCATIGRVHCVTYAVYIACCKTGEYVTQTVRTTIRRLFFSKSHADTASNIIQHVTTCLTEMSLEPLTACIMSRFNLMAIRRKQPAIRQTRFLFSGLWEDLRLALPYPAGHGLTRKKKHGPKKNTTYPIRALSAK